ncbi:MAG: CBS domain-containing protein [Pseudomonadales bacterium]|jgi:acetoin utilization protein AcuB|nr:CBS domain-containing protein [Pseudomonadales bacterium]
MKNNPLIKSVMTPFPHSIDIDASIIDARKFMMSHHIRHLPVTDNTELVGILTDRDIKLILGPDFDYPSQQELSVRDVYIDTPYIVSLDEPLTNVLAHMVEKHIGSALVTRKGKLAGVFTSTDVCRSFYQFLTEKLSSNDGNDAA